MTDSRTLLLRSAEAYLGSSGSRFFGAGYRRTKHTLTDVVISPHSEGAGAISATAAVAYPEDWSRKGTANQPPHLSTVDVIALGEQLTSRYLQGAYGLSPWDSRIVTGQVME